MKLNKNKNKRVGHVKTIIIIGYLALIALAVYGVFRMYSELRKFSEYEMPLEGRRELVLISETLTNLYESENVISMLMSDVAGAKDRQYYDSLFFRLSSQIDSVYQLSSNELLRSRLDSITVLLDLKYTNTKSILQLTDSINKIPLQKKTMTTILSQKNMDDLVKIYKNQVQEKTDTTILQVKKKSFARRLSDVFHSNVVDSVVVSSNVDFLKTDSLLPLRNYTDTVVQYVSDVFMDYGARRERFIQQLAYRQNLLFRTNDNLTAQINQILHDLELREYEKNMQFLNEKDNILSSSSKVANRIALVALFTAILFLLFSLASLSLEQKYRSQLEDAKKYAEDLLKRRERLMLTLSHDIKAPLSSIIGYLELLSKSRLADKGQYYVKNMQNSSEHALELVTNLLDYHRLESEKQEILQKMYFSPHRLVNDTYQSFVPISSKKGLTFNLINEVETDQFYQSDPLRIRQILGNLLSNAIKFTDTGTITLNASVFSEKKKDVLKIVVQDTGCGISSEHKEHIFEEFTRTDSSDYQGIEGSGLGLAISRRLVWLLDGDIQVESEVNAGSKFTVLIPLELARTALPERKEQLFLEKKDLKILFIDDDLVLLNMYKELIQGEGLIPVMCSNSFDALNILKRTPFDLVFTDIQMPDMNGFELVDHIRNSTFLRAKEIPVIALSARSDISEQKFKEVGFTGFLSKPFTSKQLLEIIAQYANMPKSEEENAAFEEGFNALASFAGNDKEAARNIVQTFIEENTTTVSKMEAALVDKDWSLIQSSAHKLLPLMRMLKSDAIVTILCDLEDGVQDENKVKTLTILINQKNEEANQFICDNLM